MKLRIEKLKYVFTKVGPALSKVLAAAANVKKHIGKTGCDISSDDIMNLDICVSKVYNNLVSTFLSGGVSSMADLFEDPRSKNVMELALHIDAILGSGLSDALDEIDNTCSLEPLSLWLYHVAEQFC